MFLSRISIMTDSCRCFLSQETFSYSQHQHASQCLCRMVNWALRFLLQRISLCVSRPSLSQRSLSSSHLISSHQHYFYMFESHMPERARVLLYLDSTRRECKGWVASCRPICLILAVISCNKCVCLSSPAACETSSVNLAVGGRLGLALNILHGGGGNKAPKARDLPPATHQHTHKQTSKQTQQKGKAASILLISQCVDADAVTAPSSIISSGL